MKQFAQWGLLIVCLITFNKISGQAGCDFTIEVIEITESYCESNGIIKVVLKGANVDNEIIDDDKAEYIIESIHPGGYKTESFDANNGNLQGIPPGEYNITVRAYCSVTHTYVYKKYGPVTMPGTYPGFSQDQMEINTAGIVGSKRCSPTGVIPIHVGSGRAPYSVRIMDAPDPELIGSVFTYDASGDYYIEDVTWGKYRLAFSDACEYTVYREPTVSTIDPTFDVTKIENTPKCLSKGKIHLLLENGVPPYTITLTVYPGEYTGKKTLTVSTDETDFIIENLPKGTYGFTISDLCYTEDFEKSITDEELSAIISLENSSSLPCKEEGEIKFKLSGGLPPYIITVSCSRSDCPYDIAVSAAKDTTIKVFPGDYTFSVMDKCKEKIVDLKKKVDSIKLEVVKPEVNAVSSCNANDGTATVTIKGGAPPYNNVSLLNETTNSTVPNPFSGPPYKFENLAVGDYKFKITDDCGISDSASFSIKRDSLSAKHTEPVLSIGCGASGEIGVVIEKGTPDYTLIISQNGTTISTLGPSNETNYKFEYLPPGTYKIKVTDNCNDSVVFNDIEIKSFNFEGEPDGSGSMLSADLYDDTFSPLADKNCYKVLVNRKKPTNTSFGNMWTTQPHLFEVAFVPNSNPNPPWTWVDVKDSETLSFDVKHCDAMRDDSIYTVYIRMKVDDPDVTFCNDTLKDIIKFPPVSSSVSLLTNGCMEDTWRITHDKFMCTSYKIIVTDTINNTSQEHSYSNEYYSYKDILRSHGTYIIEVKDDNCTWLIDTVTANAPPPNTSPVPQYEGFNCNTYSMYFDFNYNCYPYAWILREKDEPETILRSEEISSSTDYNNKQKRTQTGLEYGKKYEICIVIKLINNKQDTVQCTEVLQKERLNLTPYKLDFTPQYCLPDTGKGYIRLFRQDNSGNPINFEKGAVISFVDDDGSSPQTPIHTEYIVPDEGIKDFYPFSGQEQPLQKTITSIEEGRYKFEILDSCGKRDTIHVDYKKSTVKDFGYERTIGCRSTDITPEGSIYLGDTKITSYFRIIKVPDGVAPITEVITEGGFFTIDRTGHYVLQISESNRANSCPFDTIGIDFIKENVSLDADATRTYVCEEGTDGYIRVRAKGGVGPFTYELYDNGESKKKVEGVQKGEYCEFYYGRYGESYTIKIYDVGCGIEFPTPVYMLDLSKTRIINDNIKLCIGEDIQLTCLPLGDYTGYNWTGEKEWTSTDQNPVIPNATIDMSGTYSIEVYPKGCSKSIKQYVDVEVLNPSPPPGTTIYYCLNDPAVPLTSTPDDGYYLKWYDNNNVHVSSPPTPTTNQIGTFDYFVSQVNLIYGCESEKATIRVIIEDFPDPYVHAEADSICKNDAPVIIIPDTYIYPDYIYRIYNSSSSDPSSAGLTGMGTAVTADTLRIPTSERMERSGIVYVEVETNHQCVSVSRSPVEVIVVHPEAPVVHDTLYCIGETDVRPLRADSMRGNSLQWYDTNKNPLSSAPVPPTDVAGEFSYWVAQKDISLGCLGDTAELKVTIQDLPSIDIDASAPEICRRTSPTVIVRNTYNKYTYTLFDENNNTIDSKIATADRIVLNLHSPDYTLSQDKYLYVEVQDQYKCTSSNMAEIAVSVVIPDVPQVFDTLYCLNAIPVSLRAIPDEGYYIQWYDINANPAGSAPVPPTNIVDTLHYNVSQKHETLHCESDTVQIEVIIDALPDPFVHAEADSICKNDAPVVIIPDTYIYRDYIYRIYNSSDPSSAGLTGMGIAVTADTLRIPTSERMEHSGIVYVEVETTHQCVSVSRSPVEVTVVHPEAPVVHDTLYCIGETDVRPLRADSTRGNSLQWYDTNKNPLPSTPVPPTDVAGEFSYWVAQKDISLGCLGDTAELKVTIQDLPSIDIDASAPEICRRTSPTVIVRNTYNEYTYTLFDKNKDTIDSRIASADGIVLNLNSPTFILHQNEDLYVEVQDQYKCTSSNMAEVSVSVVIPDVPQVFDTLYCMNATAVPLQATPGEGYYIQWYDINANPATSTPIPPTNIVDTLYYNVSQKHETLHCESDTVQIEVIIDALPDTVKANSPPICPGQYPVIKIPVTKSDIIYNVYSASGTILAFKQGSDDSIRIDLPYPIYESENYYVETMNVNKCVSEDRSGARTEVINYMYLLPETIPQYKRGKLYSVQLESNAVSPYEFSTDDLLPFGFTLSVDGLISGTPPWNGLTESVPFHVIVVDVNGCYAERDYVLESDIFIPQAFTPNGDGKNDIFMKGRRLVIFDRLGLKIFEGDDGWDGRRLDGTPAPPDTYFYLIYYEDENLMTQGRKKGYITLIRRQR